MASSLSEDERQLGPNMRFLPGVDGAHLASVLAKLNQDSTLFIKAPKTFTTTTTTNASAKEPTSKSKIFDSNNKQVVSYGATRSSVNSKESKRKSKDNLAKFQAAKRRSSVAGEDELGGAEGGANDPESGAGGGPQMSVADIIGSFGWFQLLVLIFSGLREASVGYDALVMSIILQPELKYICADNLQATHQLSDPTLTKMHGHAALANFSALLPHQTTAELNETAQCFRSLDGGLTPQLDPVSGEPQRCQSWIFSNESTDNGKPSLVAQWQLVCQYHWLVAFIESAYFFGLVTGNLTWGYYADKVGRRPVYLAAHTICLVFGSLAVVAPNIYIFAFCRFFSAFGSIGYNIIYSIQVELIGAKHRSFSTIMNHLGWGLGVICVPLVNHIFDDYRPIIAVAPVLSLMMFPWAFWLPESSRWLMAHGRFKEAQRELLRAAAFNGKTNLGQLMKKIIIWEQKIKADQLKQNRATSQSLAIGKDRLNYKTGKEQESNNPNSNNDVTKSKQVRSYGLIFTNRRLLRDTLILSYLAFVGHLFYYLQTINFAYVKNLSTAANFITSGAGEWVSVVVGAILLKFFSRKTCMSIFLLFMTCSFSFQSFIDSGIMPELDTKVIITANNGIGTLASLLLVFVTLIVNQEVYPTIVRQTGTSITNTLGESGSTLAPLIIQFSRIIGAWEANVIYSIFCLFGIVAAQFVTRTDDIELSDI